MKKQNQTFPLMGILNLTDNSFFVRHNTKDSIEKSLKLIEDEVLYIDVGAESTAPMNIGISQEEEISRFETLLFPLLYRNIFKNKILSIDTYRPSTFLYIYRFIKKENLPISLVFNDVSGVLDDELVLCLKEAKDVSYVFSHCLANTRENLAEKQMMITDNNLDLYTYFLEGLKFFKNHNILNEIILDPCFGFSKTYEQNIEILKTFHDLVLKFPLGQKFLIGISQKSFLKKQFNTQDPQELKRHEKSILSGFEKTIKEYEVIVRTHFLNKID